MISSFRFDFAYFAEYFRCCQRLILHFDTASRRTLIFLLFRRRCRLRWLRRFSCRRAVIFIV